MYYINKLYNSLIRNVVCNLGAVRRVKSQDGGHERIPSNSRTIFNSVQRHSNDPFGELRLFWQPFQRTGSSHRREPSILDHTCEGIHSWEGVRAFVDADHIRKHTVESRRNRGLSALNQVV